MFLKYFYFFLISLNVHSLKQYLVMDFKNFQSKDNSIDYSFRPPNENYQLRNFTLNDLVN